ncbi:MAG: FHA domain-containing protein, partial [Gammaproteobacteria bacterium]
SGEPLVVPVTRSELAQSVAGLIGQIDTLVQGLVDPALGAPMIYVTQRLDFGPEVVGTLATAYGGAHVLPENAALDGVHSELAMFGQKSSTIGLITERPNHGSVQAEVATAVPTSSHAPASHILVDHQIHRIADNPFVIGTATPSESWGYRVTGNVKGVSRKHCEILRDDSRIVLRDLSTFGTYVNGRRVEGEVALGEGDIVRLGNPGVELRIVQEAAADGEA